MCPFDYLLLGNKVFSNLVVESNLCKLSQVFGLSERKQLSALLFVVSCMW